MARERIGVVGAGQMGGGIAEVCARAGCDVVVREVDQAAARRGEERVRTSLDKGVERGKLAQDDRDGALERLRFTTDLADLADRSFVIEAVIEDEAAKTAVFAELDQVVEAGDAVLASNTSSIPIAKLARATGRAEWVIGTHFFNPVPVMGLVEIIPSLLTDEPARSRSRELTEDVLGKRAIWCKDRAGFVVNALLIPYLLSAVRMLESGQASAADIDTGMVEGCSHPMGPLRLLDFVGLDVALNVAESLHSEYRQPMYAPPPLLARMVEAGLLGRKTGRGFYDY